MIDQNYATENWRLESCKNPSEKNVVHEDVELPSSATSHVGGTCWCPDGQSYDVADTSKGSCEGGVTEPSKRHDSSSGPWSRRRVMCACPRPILELRARLAMRAVSNSTARHSRRPGSRRERRERRRAMEDAAVALLELPGETSVVEASQLARAQGSAECGLRTVEFTFTDVSSIPFTLTSRLSEGGDGMGSVLFAGESCALDTCIATSPPTDITWDFTGTWGKPDNNCTGHCFTIIGSTNVGLNGSLSIVAKPDRVWTTVSFSGAKVTNVVVTKSITEDDGVVIVKAITGRWDPKTQMWEAMFPWETLDDPLTLQVTQEAGTEVQDVNAHFTGEKLLVPKGLTPVDVTWFLTGSYFPNCADGTEGCVEIYGTVNPDMTGTLTFIPSPGEAFEEVNFRGNDLIVVKLMLHAPVLDPEVQEAIKEAMLAIEGLAEADLMEPAPPGPPQPPGLPPYAPGTKTVEDDEKQYTHDITGSGPPSSPPPFSPPDTQRTQTRRRGPRHLLFKDDNGQVTDLLADGAGQGVTEMRAAYPRSGPCDNRLHEATLLAVFDGEAGDVSVVQDALGGREIVLPPGCTVFKGSEPGAYDIIAGTRHLKGGPVLNVKVTDEDGNPIDGVWDWSSQTWRIDDPAHAVPKESKGVLITIIQDPSKSYDDIDIDARFKVTTIAPSPPPAKLPWYFTGTHDKVPVCTGPAHCYAISGSLNPAGALGKLTIEPGPRQPGPWNKVTFTGHSHTESSKVLDVDVHDKHGNAIPGDFDVDAQTWRPDRPMDTNDIVAVYVHKAGNAPGDVNAHFTPGTAKPPPKVTVHGDPMFKKNGVGLQFSLPLGRPSELLAWPNKAGESVVLTGTTFERTTTGHQWFNSFAMSVDGREIFNVSVAKVGRGTMRVLVDGKVVVPPDVTRLSSALHAGTSFELSMLKSKRFMIGHKSAQMLTVRTGVVTFSVYSSKAGKFDDMDDQFKFRHLNVKLDSGVPKSARGIFAELAGANAMSQATRELLHKPKLYDKLMRLEKREERRHHIVYTRRDGKPQGGREANQKASRRRSAAFETDD